MHEGSACRACHREPIFELPAIGECLSCHVIDDVHGGALGFEPATPTYMTTGIDCGPDPLDHGYTISTWVRTVPC